MKKVEEGNNKKTFWANKGVTTEKPANNTDNKP
jgi:hypothetical protein